MQTLADQLIDNLEAFVEGEPKNLVSGFRGSAGSFFVMLGGVKTKDILSLA
jgi:hypothetical protein